MVNLFHVAKSIRKTDALCSMAIGDRLVSFNLFDVLQPYLTPPD